MCRAAIVAALLLALPAAAGATPVKQYQPKAHAACRAHYVKRVETVKEHKHGKIVKVEQTWCVYVVPKTKAPAPLAVTPVLAVQLDPSFTQSPTNLLEVTYSYSASATIGGSPDSSLPDGVLEFFSDGLLECSEDVGGQIDGGTCEVTYTTYGAHTVNVIYDSGSESATTGNETETIEPPSPVPPPPALATTTTVTLTPTTCEVDGSALPFLIDQPGTCWSVAATTVDADANPVAGPASLVFADVGATSPSFASPAVICIGADGLFVATGLDAGESWGHGFVDTPPYTVTATYGGAAGYLGSTSGTVTLGS
jgi:hypothetical protein